MNKFIRRLASAAMAAALTLSMGIAAFAASAEAVDATITKEMVMAEGTTTPAGDVKFVVTPVSVDDHTDKTDTMPVIGTDGVVSVHLNKTATGAVTDGKKTVIKESVPLFANVTWPHAGTYVYTITETADTFTLTADEKMDYDKSEYKMTVQVFNNDDGPYVGAIATEKTKDSNGNTISTTTKVEATVGYNGSNACVPGDDNDTTGKSKANDPGNGLRFVNSYAKIKSVSDPTNASSIDDNLFVGAEVDGNLGDKEQYFTFTTTVTAPTVNVSGMPTTYTAYIVAAAQDGTLSKVTTGTENGVSFGTGGAVAVTPGTALNFSLKHGQKLVFTNVPVGATYTAAETDDATGYTYKSRQVVNGSAAVETANNKAFAVTRIGETKNSATVINTREAVEITGIIENTLPYVLMILVALGGVVALGAFKRRKLVK